MYLSANDWKQTTAEAETTVDARGATCPGPLMDRIGELRGVETGAVVALLSDAEKSTTDVREWADESGNEATDIVDGTVPATNLAEKLDTPLARSGGRKLIALGVPPRRNVGSVAPRNGRHEVLAGYP